MQKEDSPCRAGGVGYDHANPGVQTNTDSKVTANPAVATNPEPVTPEPDFPFPPELQDQARFTQVSLELPEGLTKEKWEKIGHGLGKLDQATQWWLGDWWAFGEHRYGDRKALVESEEWTGPAFQTCINASNVCKKFETCRRRHVLPFAHHAEVAACDPSIADSLLDWSEEPLRNGKRKPRSARELREEVIRRRNELLSSGGPTLPEEEGNEKRFSMYGDFISVIWGLARIEDFDPIMIITGQNPGNVNMDLKACRKAIKRIRAVIKEMEIRWDLATRIGSEPVGQDVVESWMSSNLLPKRF